MERKSEARRDLEEAGRDAKRGMEDAGDKLKAGANAVKNKLEDTGRDIDVEYQKEKAKEKLK